MNRGNVSLVNLVNHLKMLWFAGKNEVVYEHLLETRLHIRRCVICEGHQRHLVGKARDRPPPLVAKIGDTEAHRLLKLLKYFAPIYDYEIPPTSLLREFFGGSSLTILINDGLPYIVHNIEVRRRESALHVSVIPTIRKAMPN